jgi:ABC-type phosphate transport system permease subunit
MIMVIGNSPVIAKSLFGQTSTLPSWIATYAEGVSTTGTDRSALFAMSVVLFVLIIIVDGTALLILRRGNRGQSVT